MTRRLQSRRSSAELCVRRPACARVSGHGEAASRAVDLRFPAIQEVRVSQLRLVSRASPSHEAEVWTPYVQRVVPAECIITKYIHHSHSRKPVWVVLAQV